MTILRPSESTQTITIIPRYDVDNITLKLRDESKATVETFTDLSTYYNNGYLSFSFDKTVVEGGSYELEILDDETVIFRGKAFATDETDLENYKINQ
jgi:hypothetical protein